MQDYYGQIQKIKKKSFPLLKNHKIVVKRTKNFYGIRVIYLHFFTLYFVGNGAKKGLSKGGIAHELSHIEIFKKWGFWKTLLFSFLQLFFDKYKKKIESGADLLAIKKGYGKELYKTRKKKASKRIRKLLDKYYLSLKEIKEYAKKNKSKPR